MSAQSRRAVLHGTSPNPEGADPSGAVRHPLPSGPGAALVTRAGGDPEHDWGWAVSGPGAVRRDPGVLVELVEQHGAGGWCPECDEWECPPGVVLRRDLMRLRVGGSGGGMAVARCAT